MCGALFGIRLIQSDAFISVCGALFGMRLIQSDAFISVCVVQCSELD